MCNYLNDVSIVFLLIYMNEKNKSYSIESFKYSLKHY